MVAITVGVLSGLVAIGYFTIAGLILPRIQVERATPGFVRAFRGGGVLFFAGCGLTHTHLAIHAFENGDRTGVHELLFHGVQVIGVWVFVFAAVRLFEVRVVPRLTSQQREAAELEREIEQLSRSNTDLERFAHVISHDLQDPLRTVAGFAGLLSRRYDGALDDRADEYLDHIVGGCQRMSAMLDGVLTYSRAAAAELTLRTVELDEVVAGARAGLRAMIDERGVTMHVEALPRVQGDPVALGQLMQNLLANAIRFTPPDRTPRIRISAEDRGLQWCVSVQDNGIGVDPRDARRIFDMFTRAGEDDDGAGRGVGLAVCYRIVERHGGELSVQPAPGGGSVFRFVLPKPDEELVARLDVRAVGAQT